MLALIAEGLSNQDIAGRLGIGEKTVKTHVSNVLGKLNVSDRTQAAVYAWKSGLKKRPGRVAAQRNAANAGAVRDRRFAVPRNCYDPGRSCRDRGESSCAAF